MPIEFKDVARALSSLDFAKVYLPMSRKSDRARCPFHGGEHYNLAFYRDGKCHCFTCGKGGDVVTLAATVWGTNQHDAAVRLNSEFHLGLSDDSSGPDPAEARRRQRERDRREAEHQQECEAWQTAADDLRNTETAACGFSLADAENPATWAAVAKLGAAQDKWAAMWAGW